VYPDDAQPFHRGDAFRPTASKHPSCQTLGGSACGFVSVDLGMSRLEALRAARLPAVFRPRAELARHRSLYAHHLRATRPSSPASCRPALPVPRDRRPPSLPACGPFGHVMLGACNPTAFAVGLRLTQRSSGQPTAAHVCVLLHHLRRRWLPLTSTLGGSACGSVSFELCVFLLAALRAARLPAVFRPRVELARHRSLYAHHLRAT
jgi:hypothetical protein